MIIVFAKSFKNQSGYYLIGSPARWHKFDKDHPAPVGAHHVVQAHYHEKAVEKHMAVQHASNLSAAEMIAQVTATGQALQRAATNAAKVSTFRTKMIAGQKPAPAELAAFMALPADQKAKIRAEIEAKTGNGLLFGDPDPRLAELKESVQKYVDVASNPSKVPTAGATPVPSPAVSGGSSKERIVYDTMDLSNPDTYLDPKVRAAAIAAAGLLYQGHGNGKEARMAWDAKFLAGEYPEHVKAQLDAWHAREVAANKAKAEKQKSVDSGLAAIDGFTIPGHSVSVDGNNIVISGPFDQDLHERIKRAGGYWDGATGTNKRVWIMPAEKGATLKRIVSNAKKKVEKTAADAAAKADAAKQALAEARAAAPKIAPGKYGPFSVSDVGTGYRVSFSYDAARVAQIKASGGKDYHSWDKTWLIDKTDAAKLMSILAKAKEEQAAQPAQPTSSGQSSQTQAQQRRLYPLSSMPMFGKPARLHGKPVVFTGKGDSFRISEDHPSTHGSHLLGHEGGLGAYAYYRPATQEEESMLIAGETAAKQAADSAQARAKTLSDAMNHIMANGERPVDVQPDGDAYHDTFNIYGSGDRFVVGKNHIWYVKNHGMDGDDWSANNIKTGGAGAIGWRVPYSDELAAKIKGA